MSEFENYPGLNLAVNDIEQAVDVKLDADFVVRVRSGVVTIDEVPTRHIIEMRENGFSLEHPAECRPEGRSLHDCQLWREVRERSIYLEDSELRGRFFASMNEGMLVLQE